MKFNRVQKIGKQFKKFNASFTNPAKLYRHVKGNKSLKKVVNTIFSKKGAIALGITGTTTAIGVGVDAIIKYIHNNSGCFLYDEKNDTACKMNTLSCCQPADVKGLASCRVFETAPKSVCDNYNENFAKSCCRFCDCQFHDCSPTEKMTCKRATVGEALSFFAEYLGVSSIMTYVRYAMVVVIIFIVLFLLSFLR